MAHSSENLTFVSSSNAEYIAHLFAAYLKDPSGVDASWQAFFGGLGDSEIEVLQELTGASWTPEENRKSARAFGLAQFADAEVVDVSVAANEGSRRMSDQVSRDELQAMAKDSVSALALIRAHRVRGHLMADLDPLGLKEVAPHPELDPAHYGFTAADMNKTIYIGGALGMQTATLQDIVTTLKETYCGKIGVEYMHMTDPEEKLWIQERIEEPHNKTEFSIEGKTAILERLTAAEGFEQFLNKKHTGTKRFGIDGGEALIPAMEQIMKRGGQLGLEEIVIGMAHRGRLNVLANVMSKPFTTIFAEFQGHSSISEDVLGSGDVKYHLGTSSDREFDGNEIHLSLTANPSHLEFVNPVVIGKVRAKQVQREDKEQVKVMPILLHGDAAFAGQGITAETLMISDLPGYRVGGTMHIVINNQIGFTTVPQFSRSGPYCTDVAKMLSAPIFHVNGDDPEAVVHVARIATEFRQKFKKDVVIDMYCYRRYGHNEGDEPAFTQPLMYKKIAEQETTRSQYEKQLIAEGTIDEVAAQKISDDFMAEMDAAFAAVEDFEAKDADYLDGAWSGLKVAPEGPRRGETAVSSADMKRVGEAVVSVPDGFSVNRKLQRVLDARHAMFNGKKAFDWGTAEAAAFATLLDDGFGVRLSGQDVGRGTFSHRHATWYDQENGEKYVSLQHVKKGQGPFEVHDSPLSEMAVLGFEYGFTLSEPKSLVLWEAQFGDFTNGAQVMIDQFISSGEIKWLRMSGLVMLLPHGYEGQGPEHSSARPERFLAACAEDNWQVANCTTPANYFHILRRQMSRDFRKPLVMMTPKSLLRHKLAVSEMDMFTGDSTFHRFLWDDDKDDLVKADKMKRVVLCTGKVYYDLLAERRERGIKDVTLIRVEQLYPFPMEDLATELAQYKNADVIWCQEEPENMGYWQFVDRRIEQVLKIAGHKAARPVYIGRPDAAAPATGLMNRHVLQQKRLLDEALTC